MLNKKSNIILLFLIIMMFGIVSVMLITAGYLMFAVGNDYVVLPLYNSSLQTNQTALIQTGFNDIVENYQDFDLGFIDTMMFVAYSLLVIMSFPLAYRDRTNNYFSWLSILTTGIIFLLFIVGLFHVVITYFYNDILLNLFNNLAINMPFLALYVENYGLWFLIHACALMLVRVVDFDFRSFNERKQREDDSISSDEVI